MTARIVDVEALRIPAHVSGPWQVVSENYNHGQLARYAISSGTRAVAATIDGELPTVARSIADLIAAAPDLLAEVIERRARDAQVAELAEALSELRRDAVILSDDYLETFRDWPMDATVQGWDKARWLRASAAAKRADAALSAIRGGATG
jgi:hypothetical protein